MSLWGSRVTFAKENENPPIVYNRSVSFPDESVRGGSLDVASIPGEPLLRLGVTEWNMGDLDQTVVIDREQVAKLHAFFGLWLEEEA